MNQQPDANDRYFNYLQGRTRLGALYRRWLLYPRLSRRMSGRTLDIGCGIGDMLAYRDGTIGVDINPRTVAYCRTLGLPAEVMEADRLPFETATFDCALLDNVLEHIVDPSPLLSEACRVLVPSGRLLVGIPGRRGWDSDPDHKVYYSASSLTETVCAAGFELIEVFHTPLIRSTWLEQRLRQYCVFGLFSRTP